MSKELLVHSLNQVNFQHYNLINYLGNLIQLIDYYIILYYIR